MKRQLPAADPEERDARDQASRRRIHRHRLRTYRQTLRALPRWEAPWGDGTTFAILFTAEAGHPLHHGA